MRVCTYLTRARSSSYIYLNKGTLQQLFWKTEFWQSSCSGYSEVLTWTGAGQQGQMAGRSCATADDSQRSPDVFVSPPTIATDRRTLTASNRPTFVVSLLGGLPVLPQTIATDRQGSQDFLCFLAGWYVFIWKVIIRIGPVSLLGGLYVFIGPVSLLGGLYVFISLTRTMPVAQFIYLWYLNSSEFWYEIIVIYLYFITNVMKSVGN